MNEKHPEELLLNLLALLEGLEVPNPCLCASQEDSETLRLLGAAICEQAKANNWQPIETAPKDGSFILVSDGYDQYVVKWIDPLDEENESSDKKTWCIDGCKCDWLPLNSIPIYWKHLSNVILGPLYGKPRVR